jgi:hypothetical protein
MKKLRTSPAINRSALIMSCCCDDNYRSVEDALIDASDAELLAEVTKRGYEVVEDAFPPKWRSAAACQAEYNQHMMYLKRCRYEDAQAWSANLK